MAKMKTKNMKIRKIIIRDPAIVKFLLQHLKPSKVDLSKIKFPIYIDINN